MSSRWHLMAFVLLVSLALGALPGLGQAPPQRPKPAPSPSPSPTVSAEERPAVSLNGGLLLPGDVLQSLFGIAGPPDFVQAVRGKDVANDFVKFAYHTHGLSVHVKTDKSQANILDAIVVMNVATRLVNVPFKIGDEYKAAMTAWGQPDRQEPGFMAYWKRGVYVGVSEDGHIIHITLTVPGQFDEDEPTQPQKGFAPPARRFGMAAGGVR